MNGTKRGKPMNNTKKRPKKVKSSCCLSGIGFWDEHKIYAFKKEVKVNGEMRHLDFKRFSDEVMGVGLSPIFLEIYEWDINQWARQSIMANINNLDQVNKIFEIAKTTGAAIELPEEFCRKVKEWLEKETMAIIREQKFHQVIFSILKTAENFNFLLTMPDRIKNGFSYWAKEEIEKAIGFSAPAEAFAKISNIAEVASKLDIKIIMNKNCRRMVKFLLDREAGQVIRQNPVKTLAIKQLKQLCSWGDVLETNISSKPMMAWLNVNFALMIKKYGNKVVIIWLSAKNTKNAFILQALSLFERKLVWT